MIHRWTFYRKLDKLEFCKLHSNLFSKCPIDFHGNVWKEKIPMQIIKTARRELKYSSKTSSCDIYYSLWKFNKDNKYLIK